MEKISTTKFVKSACLFQIVREKSCDYMLIINMKKYEITVSLEQSVKLSWLVIFDFLGNYLL